jgi:hypothetical protein
MRALGNAGDGVSLAFPDGKQNGEKKELFKIFIAVNTNLV